jgi:hypothetical protein
MLFYAELIGRKIKLLFATLLQTKHLMEIKILIKMLYSALNMKDMLPIKLKGLHVVSLNQGVT